MYFLLIKAYACEQPAQGCYLKAERPGVEPANSESRVQCPAITLPGVIVQRSRICNVMYVNVEFKVTLHELVRYRDTLQY